MLCVSLKVREGVHVDHQTRVYQNGPFNYDEFSGVNIPVCDQAFSLPWDIAQLICWTWQRRWQGRKCCRECVVYHVIHRDGDSFAIVVVINIRNFCINDMLWIESAVEYDVKVLFVFGWKGVSERDQVSACCPTS